jgi:DTW domain-containing protein
MSAHPSADTHKRTLCTKCLRPQSACICHWMAPIAHETEVLILQHPLEVNQSKGSARLLHGCLTHSALVVGERFDEPALRSLLTGPKRSVLLYPDTPDDTSPDLRAPPVLDPIWLQSPAQLRLVVLDGTWRKSRKMLYLNPLLQALPRIALANLPPSHYAIRKAHRPDQLSTLEATCAALAQLEGVAEKFQPVLNAFDGFVAQQFGFKNIARD